MALVRMMIVIGFVVLSFGYANDDPPIKGAPLVRNEALVTHNASRCMPCHETRREEFEKDGVYKFIRPDCAMVWKTHDPHSRASEAIDPEKNAIAARMASALGYNVKLKPECLTCHSVDTTPNAPLTEKKFSWRYGVGCESCHGMATQWFEPHTLSTWRKTVPSEKEKLGLVDLRDPSKRTAKCATCHIGSSAEGKFVTHEMYAAGHPPLLPFEPVTFGRDQPQHWSLPETNEFIQSESAEDALRYFHVRKGEQRVPRALALGALTVLRDSARLIADHAEKESSTGNALDFAHFDCFACHKDLVSDSSRLKRGYDTLTPGRPPMRKPPIDLIRAVLAFGLENGRRDFDPELNEKLNGLRLAFDRRPFGDNKAIASAARQLEHWASDRLADMSNLHYDEAARISLLNQVLQTRPRSIDWEYDSAQQLTWAAKALGWYDKPSTELQPLTRFVLMNSLLTKADSQAVFRDRLRLRYRFDPIEFNKAWTTLRP